MPIPFVLIAVGLAVAAVAVSYIFRPRAKVPKPEAAKDLDDPVAEAGKPIPVVFGTITVKGLNVLAYTNRHQITTNVKA